MWKIKQQYISKVIHFFCKEHADFNKFSFGVRNNKTILHKALSMPHLKKEKKVSNLICEPVITKDSKSNDGSTAQIWITLKGRQI